MKIAIYYIGSLHNLSRNYTHQSLILQLNLHEVDYYISYVVENNNDLGAELDFAKSVLQAKFINNCPKNNTGTRFGNAVDKYFMLLDLNNLRGGSDIKYDAILVLQPDLIFEKEINLNKCDLNKLTVLNSTHFRQDPDISDFEYHTMFLLTSTKNMNRYANLYRYLISYKLRPQHINYHQLLSDFGLEIAKINKESYYVSSGAAVSDVGKIELNRGIAPKKVCLVVAFYFGKRENNDTHHDLIKIQQVYLQKYKHNLTGIVFAISSDDRKTIEIEKREGITYFYKPNSGLSFGSWQMVYNYYKSSYDYYIFSEDDYVFVKDNFDQIMIDEYHSGPTAGEGYMVNWKSRTDLLSTIGIVSSDTLMKINWDHILNWIDNSVQDSSVESRYNKRLTMKMFLDSFPKIRSMSKKCSAFPYWGEGDYDQWNVWLFDHICGESEREYQSRMILCPIQMIDSGYHIKPPQFSNIVFIDDNESL